MAKTSPTSTPGISNSVGRAGLWTSAAMESTSTFLSTEMLSGNRVFSTEYSNVYYPQEAVTGINWNSYFPYVLEIMKATPDGGVVPVVSSGAGPTMPNKVVLPISPSELQVRMPFATQLTATLKGIVEEHNAAPFREIAFSGTTGVLPGDARKKWQAFTPPSMIETIFGGTITSAGRLASKAQALIKPKPAAFRRDEPQAAETGHFHFMMLIHLLERYAAEKQGLSNQLVQPNEAKNLRLVLHQYREGWSWILTPREFSWKKSATDPMMYNYSFSATAWKRVKARGGVSVGRVPATRRPNLFIDGLRRMRQAVDVVYGAKAVITAIRSDLNGRLLDPLRETALFVKASASAATSLLDLPTSIRKDFLGTVAKTWNSIRNDLGVAAPPSVDRSLKDAQTDYENGADKWEDAMSSGGIPRRAVGAAVEFFNDPIPDPKFFGDVPTAVLDTPSELSDRVDRERDRVANFSKNDLRIRRQKLLLASEDLANALGLGSESYTRLVGRGANLITPAALPDVPRATSEAAMGVLFALQDAVQVLDTLIATGNVGDLQLGSLEYVSNLATEADVPFDIPYSKRLVPVPYGATLEAIARLYLGDPDRWSEIATLNALRPPYIDETGFELELLTNGNQKFFMVNNNSNLFIGQQIKLYSSAVSVFTRRVVSIESVGTARYLVTVDGDPTLDTLKVADDAKMRAFLPGTTNSEQLIYVPSNLVPAPDLQLAPIPGIDDLNYLIKLSGIDLLLDSHGDLVITDDGDTRLAYGMTNMVQAVRLKLATPQGSLFRHPDYGLGIPPGISTAEVDSDTVLKAIQAAFTDDDRFDGVQSVRVAKQGPVLQIDVSAAIANMAMALPVSVQMTLPS